MTGTALAALAADPGAFALWLAVTAAGGFAWCRWVDSWAHGLMVEGLRTGDYRPSFVYIALHGLGGSAISWAAWPAAHALL